MTINHTRKPITRRASATLATAGLLLAVVIAGCGGSGTSSQPASGASSAAHGSGAPAKPSVKGSDVRHSTPSAGGQAAAAAAAAAKGSQQKPPPTPNTASQAPAASSENVGIPQNNGGDQDADNNGGPSDGDGNV